MFFFDITASGAQAYYEFQDIHDRLIIIDLAENNPRKRKPFSLLAPMGDAVEKPVSMPLVYVHDFYFVRRKKTAIYIAVDGKEHQPDKLPIPIDFSRMFFTRYSADPLIATFNEAFSGVLEPLAADESQPVIKDEALLLHLSFKYENPAIKTLSRTHRHHTINLEFSPPFPNISTINNGTTVTGSFRIEGERTAGIISGDYSIENRGSKTIINLTPTKGWKPVPTKLSLRILYRVAKVFRRWPSTYEWTAIITEQDENNLHISSSWQRINR